ncbi:BrnT family toxin [Synechococcus sp. PCC 6312]|uniref:BrnT family toxin n=1 Tax=Synechococcus sp. (strain ATCC 27167 / PCC 6312) TaxID=195253 RepID=UPI00029F3216|nr:BrnT family toxin [Synechococcus sp. PCC 6312]AFY62779.1 hypothetical protein Syn6312_3769 [Synechococcus sp. PCC 6312]
MPPVKFEWDEAKAQSNLFKHGLSFEDATAVFFQEDAIDVSDNRYGEQRWQRFLYQSGELICIVWTWRGEVVRIISVRRANQRERNKFSQIHG